MPIYYALKGKRAIANHDALAYEKAAFLRDRIALLRQMQSHQQVSNLKTQSSIDVFAIDHARKLACIQVLQIRSGHVIGARQYFPKLNFDYDYDNEWRWRFNA